MFLRDGIYDLMFNTVAFDKYTSINIVYYLTFHTNYIVMYRGDFMHYTKEQMAEIDILVRYNLQTTQQGIKVHSNAESEHVNAVQRLFEKGLVTQRDGGYLTDLGRKAAEHAQALILMLAPHEESLAS